MSKIEHIYKPMSDILELPPVQVMTNYGTQISLYPGLDSDKPDNKVIYYYCPLDDWLDGHDYIDFRALPEGLILSNNYCPVAKHRLSDFDLWQQGLKVKNTYVKGNRYKELSIEINDLPKGEFKNRFISALADKSLRYPNIDAEHVLNCQDVLFNYYCVDKTYEIVISTDRPVCKFYCYKGSDCLLGDLLWVTQEQKEKSRHRLFVVAHQEAIRLAYDLDLDEVSFGYYLPYKDILNLTKVKHLVFESERECDDITHKKFLDYVNKMRQVND